MDSKLLIAHRYNAKFCTFSFFSIKQKYVYGVLNDTHNECMVALT